MTKTASKKTATVTESSDSRSPPVLGAGSARTPACRRPCLPVRRRAVAALGPVQHQRACRSRRSDRRGPGARPRRVSVGDGHRPRCSRGGRGDAHAAHAVFLSRMPAETAASLADALADAGRAVSGVNGAIEATRPFAATWLAVTGHNSRQVTAERQYRLDKLQPPQGVAGRRHHGRDGSGHRPDGRLVGGLPRRGTG